LLLVLAAMALISRVKIMYRGVPLHPSDFKLIKEAFSVKNYLFAALSWKAVLVVTVNISLLAMLTVLLVRRTKRLGRISAERSAAMIAVCGIILCSALMEKPLPAQQLAGAATYHYAPAKHYDQNGFLLG